MKNVCRILGTIFLIFGIIGAIALAWNNGVTTSYSAYSGIEQERNILLTLIWFVAGILCTAIGTVVLMALGEILEHQESIIKKFSIIESKLNSVEQKDKEEDGITYNGSWKCTKCGRVNASYTGTCACGQVKQ